MTSIKSLFLAANPVDTERLSLDREVREISLKIRTSEFRDSIELISVWAVQPDDLLQSLNEYKPQIVHFSGHGSSIGEIVLVDDLGNVKPISPIALRALFATLKDNIRVVILNACYSKIQAEAITEIIDCAIGMSTAITDDASIAFIASFYRALGFGRSIQESFNQGKTALLLAGIPEENTPELLMKPGVDPNKIILIDGNNDDENVDRKKIGKISINSGNQVSVSQAPNNAKKQNPEVSQHAEPFKKDNKRFWESLRGIMIGLVAIIVAVGVLIGIAIQLDISSSLLPNIFNQTPPVVSITPTPTAVIMNNDFDNLESAYKFEGIWQRADMPFKLQLTANGEEISGKMIEQPDKFTYSFSGRIRKNQNNVADGAFQRTFPKDDTDYPNCTTLVYVTFTIINRFEMDSIITATDGKCDLRPDYTEGHTKNLLVLQP